MVWNEHVYNCGQLKTPWRLLLQSLLLLKRFWCFHGFWGFVEGIPIRRWRVQASFWSLLQLFTKGARHCKNVCLRHYHLWWKTAALWLNQTTYRESRHILTLWLFPVQVSNFLKNTIGLQAHLTLCSCKLGWCGEQNVCVIITYI